MSACNLDGQRIPDHGDFWQLPWSVLPSDREKIIILTAQGFSQPLSFTKRISLSGSCLRIEYTIENRGGIPTSFLYATHPLLAVTAGDRIVLPKEVSELTVHDSRRNRLGCANDRIPWPTLVPAHGDPIDISVLSPAQSQTADMLYTNRLKAGWCGLYRSEHQQGITVRFDTAALPYLGLWICAGGWPGDDTKPKQYAFAPEPTTAPCGSLVQALARGHAILLQPATSFSFSIDFCISEPRTSLAEFQVSCSHPNQRDTEDLPL